jgi:pimeloyl-ACP methyl ester carboxylesterase
VYRLSLLATFDEEPPIVTRSASAFTDSHATYYDVLEPADGPTGPAMVLVHGGGHTGACYLATADNRPGWAYDFVRHGHRVIVPDWPGTGRSGHVAADVLSADVVCRGLADVIRAQPEPVVLLTHSMGGHFGWKLLEMLPERIELLIGIACAPPGNMQPLPIVLRDDSDELHLQRFAGSTVQKMRHGEPMSMSGDAAEFKLIGPGTQFPREFSERYLNSLIPVPWPLILQRMNFQGSALRIDRVESVAGKRIELIHGTHDPDHPPEFEQSVADWLNTAGAHATRWALGEHGISGNGHMMMLERNSSTIADFIAALI